MNTNKTPDEMEDLLETGEGTVQIVPTITEPKEEYKNDDLEKLAPSKLPFEALTVSNDFTLKTYKY